MKKFILPIMILILAISLCGCGADAVTESAAATVTPSATEVSAPSPSPTPEPKPEPTPSPTPGLFDNADVTLNGCNNQGVAFTANGVLYVKEENFDENKVCDMCILHPYDIESDEPMQTAVFEAQLVETEDYWVNTKFIPICVYQGDYYLIREIRKDIKEADDQIYTYTIERFKADGNTDILYKLPEGIFPTILSMGDACWKTGKYIFFSYYIINPKNKDAASDYMLFRIDMETGKAQEMMSGLRNFSMQAYDGQYIYYYVQSAESEVRADMYRMDLDCKNKELLVKTTFEYGLMFSEGKFYFLEQDYSKNEKIPTLCSMSTDGQDKKEIAEIDIPDIWPGNGGRPINIAGGYIYYSDNRSLFRMSVEGGKPQKISDYENILGPLDIAVGRLFFKYRSSNGEQMVTMLPDGSGVMELF